MKAKPWIGKHYDGLLILGESGYPWKEDHVRHPSADHAKQSVRWVISDKHWNGDKTAAQFLWKVTRALTKSYDSTEAERQRAWDSCAFVNYVHSTGNVNRRRPTKAQFDEAQLPFLELLEKLRPHRVVVLGKTMWSSMPPCADGPNQRGGDLQTYRLADGARVWALALHHPTYGPGWESYAKTIEKFRKLKLQTR